MNNSVDKNIINCTNVSKRFGFFFALKKISFMARENTIFGIVGENGAGKTTLIKILSGLMKPTSGRILIGGMNYDNQANRIKKIIGTITDKSYLYEELTIYENLKFYDNLHFNFEKDKIKTKVERFSKLLNLNDWIYEPVQNLSKGMKQKVEIIRILMHHPLVLLLDEPFTGLDFKTVELLINMFRELKKKDNLSMVFTTHKIDVALQICDELIILKRGKINKLVTKEDFNELEIETYF